MRIVLFFAVVVKLQSTPLTPKVPLKPTNCFSSLFSPQLCHLSLLFPLSPSHQLPPLVINQLQPDLTKETFISKNPFRQTGQSERPFWGTRVGLFSSADMLLWEELHTKLPPAAPRTEYQTQTYGPYCIVLHRIWSLFVWDGKFEGRDTRDSSLSCSWDSLSLL